MGSADLMPRNLNRRVEVLFPVEDPAIVRRLRDEILAVYLARQRQGALHAGRRHLRARRRRPKAKSRSNSQAWFIEHAADRAPRPSGGATRQAALAAGR